MKPEPSSGDTTVLFPSRIVLSLTTYETQHANISSHISISPHPHGRVSLLFSEVTRKYRHEVDFSAVEGGSNCSLPLKLPKNWKNKVPVEWHCRVLVHMKPNSAFFFFSFATMRTHIEKDCSLGSSAERPVRFPALFGPFLTLGTRRPRCRRVCTCL